MRELFLGAKATVIKLPDVILLGGMPGGMQIARRGSVELWKDNINPASHNFATRFVNEKGQEVWTTGWPTITRSAPPTPNPSMQAGRAMDPDAPL